MILGYGIQYPSLNCVADHLLRAGRDSGQAILRHRGLGTHLLQPVAAKDGSRVKQQYVAVNDGKLVERSEMTKGYEFAKDQYVTVLARGTEGSWKMRPRTRSTSASSCR